jgi:hypothetical protein
MTSAVPAHRARRVGLTAVLAGSLVAGSAIVATTVAAPASAEDNAFTSLVTLQTGSTNEWQWFPADPTGTVLSQPIAATSTNNCTIKTPGGSVATLGGAPKGPGLRSGSIGIAEKNSGESCGQVNAPGEVLSINLGSKIANQAVLDLELQKNAVVLATLTGPSGTIYLELQTGSSITNARTPAPAGAPAGEDVTLATCQVEASSAPNSGSSDNCRWVIDATFTAISLKAIKGNASLEGGADGSVTRLSSTEGVQDAEPLPAAKDLTYFRVVEACTELNTLTTIASTGGTGLPTGQVKRSLTNVDGTPCLTDGLTATAKDATTVDILKKGQPYAQYIVKIGWRKAPTTAALKSPATSQTTIQFDIPGTTPGERALSDEEILPWCPTSLFDAATSEPVTGGGTVLKSLGTGLSDAALKAALTNLNITDMDGVDTNSVQFACIQDRDVDYVAATGTSAATFVVNDLIYVLGDLRFRS